uniref:uncharacterized protein LOC122610694 n=1 Tax=Erigeron canadensis TaxID=72917 RepID=UPI001CB914B1|nr:uncharacterized protein LOC122610694 [Erigeron canadensis]
MAIHSSSRNCCPIPVKNSIVGVWKSIAGLNSHFAPLDVSLERVITGSVGNGASLCFWIDPWIGDSPLFLAYPELFRLERQKNCRVRDRCTGAGRFSQWEWEWTNAPSTPLELFQLQDLLSRISQVSLTDKEDSWRSTIDPDGIFSVKSIKRCIKATVHGPNCWIFPWNKLAPLKVNIFCWRLEMNRIATSDLLQNRNIVVPSSLCILCKAMNETANHLFLHCDFAEQLWGFIRSWVKLPVSNPESIKELLEYHKVLVIPHGKRELLNVIILSCWTLWKTRNDCIFSGKPPSTRQAAKNIKSNSFLWITNRSKARDINWSQWSSFSF